MNSIQKISYINWFHKLRQNLQSNLDIFSHSHVGYSNFPTAFKKPEMTKYLFTYCHHKLKLMKVENQQWNVISKIHLQYKLPRNLKSNSHCVTPLICIRTCVYQRGKKCLFFGILELPCFLETADSRFVLLSIITDALITQFAMTLNRRIVVRIELLFCYLYIYIYIYICIYIYIYIYIVYCLNGV